MQTVYKEPFKGMVPAPPQVLWATASGRQHAIRQPWHNGVTLPWSSMALAPALAQPAALPQPVRRAVSPQPVRGTVPLPPLVRPVPQPVSGIVSPPPLVRPVAQPVSGTVSPPPLVRPVAQPVSGTSSPPPLVRPVTQPVSGTSSPPLLRVRRTASPPPASIRPPSPVLRPRSPKFVALSREPASARPRADSPRPGGLPRRRADSPRPGGLAPWTPLPQDVEGRWRLRSQELLTLLTEAQAKQEVGRPEQLLAPEVLEQLCELRQLETSLRELGAKREVAAREREVRKAAEQAALLASLESEREAVSQLYGELEEERRAREAAERRCAAEEERRREADAKAEEEWSRKVQAEEQLERELLRLQSAREASTTWRCFEFLRGKTSETAIRAPQQQLETLRAEARGRAEEIARLQRRNALLESAREAANAPRWQLETEEGWQNYSQESSEVLMDALQSSLRECVVEEGGELYKVNLGLLRQWKPSEMRCRRVRCRLGVPSYWQSSEEELWKRIHLQLFNVPGPWTRAFHGFGSIAVPLGADKLLELQQILRRGLFHTTSLVSPCPGHRGEFKVSQAYHVQNLPLWISYRSTCQKLLAKRRATQGPNVPWDMDMGPTRVAQPELDSLLEQLGGALAGANEQLLFHGTRLQSVEDVCCNGFDMRCCRDTNLYGRGIYFARQTCKAAQYTDCEEKCIIISRVALGVPAYVASVRNNELRPPMLREGLRADSVVVRCGKVEGPHPHPENLQLHDEFVVFESSQAYPEFVVYFT